MAIILCILCVCFPFLTFHQLNSWFPFKMVCISVCVYVYIDEVKNLQPTLFTDTEQKALVFYLFIQIVHVHYF